MAIGLLAACGDDESAGDAAPSTGEATAATDIDLSTVTLDVAVLAISSDANQRIRIMSGAFDDAPYTIKWVLFDGSNAAVEALNAGAVDAAVELQSTVAVLAIGNAKPSWTADTTPFSIVAASLPPDDVYQGIAVATDSPVQTVADLKGRKVTYARGSLQHYYWVVAAREAGLESSDVELIELPAGEGRAAFQSGAVDAVLSSTRTLVPMESRGDARVIATSSSLHLALYRVGLARRATLADPGKSAALADLLARMERAEEWRFANMDEAAKVYEEAALLDPEAAALSARESYTTRVPLDDTVTDELQRQADVFHDEGVIPESVDVSILLDPRFNAG